MTDNALEKFAEDIRAAWGPLTSDLIATVRGGLEALLRAPPEPWLKVLRAERPANTELLRDPKHGFLLLAHTETAGLYRPPHDHGRSWVVYAVEAGEIEIATYARVRGPDGQVCLVRRGADILRPGEAKAYLPGDIHDTHCLTDFALLFRFTERDLRADEARGYPIARYPRPADAQADGAAA